MSIAARIRVLIVDDTDDIRSLLRMNLEVDGRFEVVAEAADGLQAVAAAAESIPDVVVLDIAMPVMDGLEATALIREAAPDCKIVALSGFDASRMAARSLEAGVHRYIEKGTALREIADILAELCGRSFDTVPDEEAVARATWDKGERFRRVVEDGPLGVAMIGPDFKILEANDALAAMTGFTVEQLHRMNLVDLTHQDDVGLDAELADRLFHSDASSSRIEKRIVRADGRLAWVEVVATVVRDPAGTPLYGMALIDDVTHRKRVEDALESELQERTKATEELQDAHETRTAILAALSHDLRTPLTVVRGTAATLERALDKLTSEQVLELLGRISANAIRLDEMLTGLLDAERVVRGAVRADVRPVDVDRIAREVIAALDTANGRVTVEGGPARVLADETLLERTLDNLVSNALRHTAGDVPVWVRLVLDGRRALIAVEDAGDGIPPHLRERVFEPFVRGETTAKGTGMGLAIARGFVEAMGGTITVGDRPGGGTSFVIELSAA